MSDIRTTIASIQYWPFTNQAQLLETIIGLIYCNGKSTNCTGNEAAILAAIRNETECAARQLDAEMRTARI